MIRTILAWLFVVRLYSDGRHIMVKFLPWNPLTWIMLFILTITSILLAIVDSRSSVFDYFSEITELIKGSHIPLNYRPIWPWELRR